MLSSPSNKEMFRLARISVVIVFIFIVCHSLKILPSSLEILGYPPEVREETYFHSTYYIRCSAHPRGVAGVTSPPHDQLQRQLPHLLSRLGIVKLRAQGHL